MSPKYKVIIVVVALAGAFAAGRYTLPAKVVTEIKEVVKEVKEKETETNKHKETKRVIVTNPDGTITDTTTIVEDTKKNTDTTTVVDKDKSTNSETTYPTDKVTIQALGGLNFPETPVYGAAVSKPVIGPIVIGLWGLSNKTVGASIGLTF